MSSSRPAKRPRTESEDDFFMAVAVLTSKRSKDPKTQVGACIVSERKKIVRMGYNGMPHGCSDDELPWGKDDSDKLLNKHTYVCHAELNAIVNKYAPNLAGCTIYQTLYPCNECAKLIIHAGIKTILFLDKKKKPRKDTDASETLLKEAGVEIRQYQPTEDIISLLSEEPQESNTDTGASASSKKSKRDDYLSWKHYYMAMAKLSSRRSKDPSTQVGACLVAPDKRVVGLGYNDMPPGCKERWDDKHPYVCYAATNAYMSRMTSDVSDSTLYTTHFPFNECVKVIIQAGIKNIIYDSDGGYKSKEYNDYIPGAKKMLDMAGVKYSSFDAVIQKRIKVDINLRPRNALHQ